MSWGQSLKAMVRPALWIGPVQGVLTALGAIANYIVNAGRSLGAGDITDFMLVSLLLGGVGLVLMSPIWAVLGGVLLKLGAADQFYARWWVWIGVGALKGALIVGCMVIIAVILREQPGGPPLKSILVAFGVLVPPATVAGFLARRSASIRINEIHRVDTDVFA